jgi:hypothetical protein
MLNTEKHLGRFIRTAQESGRDVSLRSACPGFLRLIIWEAAWLLQATKKLPAGYLLCRQAAADAQLQAAQLG